MGGTVAGGLKAASTNMKLYGDGVVKENFYAIIVRKGGKMSRNSIFASDPEFARAMGRKGAIASLKVRREKAALK